MKFRQILKFFIILMIAAALAGCAGGNQNKEKSSQKEKKIVQKEESPGPEENKEEQIILQMWVMPNSLEPIKDIENVLADFEKQNPNIHVQITSVDWGSAWTKITTAATSGDTPDIVQLGSTWVGSISGMGALVDLSDWIAEIGGADTFVQAGWATSGIEGSGQVTSIPWFIDCRAAYYRTDVFKRLGLTPAAFNTWDSFEAALKKIKTANLEIDGIKIAPLGIPGKNDWNVIHNLSPWIWDAGGTYFNADRTSSVLNSQAAVEGLTYYTSLVTKGYVPLNCLELNTAQVSSNFNNGTYAIYFDGPYEVKTLTFPPEQGGAAGSVTSRNFAIAPYPAGPKGRFTFIGGSNLSIFKNSQHVDAAWKVIKHLMSVKSQIEYCKVNGFLPSVTKAYAHPFIAKDPLRSVFIEATKYGHTYPCITSWGLLEPILMRRFGIMWDHILASDEGDDISAIIKKELDQAAQEVNSVLNASAR